MGALEWTFLGQVDYDRALALQEREASVLGREKRCRLLLLEHPPTITLGRRAKAAHLRLRPEEYRQRGIHLRRILRGGDVTYHGPGQLVGYPIANLRRLGFTVPRWVRGHANAIRELLAELGLRGEWSDTHPGVWVEGAKVAALGFRISRGVSTHGFALNVNCPLEAFGSIVPCGLSNRKVSSLQVLGVDVPPLPALAQRLAQHVAKEFDLAPLPVSWRGDTEGEAHVLAPSA